MLLEMRPDQTEAEWKASVKDYGSFSNGTVSRETVSLDSAVMDQLEIAGRLSPELVAKRSTLSMDQAMNDVTSGETARITSQSRRERELRSSEPTCPVAPVKRIRVFLFFIT